jgi:hypothetical protein
MTVDMSRIDLTDVLQAKNVGADLLAMQAA